MTSIFTSSHDPSQFESVLPGIKMQDILHQLSGGRGPHEDM